MISDVGVTVLAAVPLVADEAAEAMEGTGLEGVFGLLMAWMPFGLVTCRKGKCKKVVLDTTTD
jgi:hypothetical protein